MATKSLIEIKIMGENITPDKISSRDVGELIAAIETMVAVIVARDNPALGIDERDVTVGLADIEYGSLTTLFQSQYEVEVLDAIHQVATSINASDYNNTPTKVIESVETVRKIARKYSTDIEFWERNGQRIQLTTVNANTKIDVKIPTFSGKTTLYGTLIRVGGESPPRAGIRLITGNYVTCNITERENLRIARQLGERLYTEVGIYGTARWDLRDMSLDHFLIEQLTEYSRKSVDEALESLSIVAGKYYDRVSDIEKLVADIRGADEEEY